MPDVTLQVYETGTCAHPWHIVAGQGTLRPAHFPARVARISHPKHGDWLFDTGYAPRFQTATYHWPEKLYALTTPVTLGTPMAEHLPPKTIKGIILSHLHADHLAGLKDFPQIPILTSRMGYKATLNKSRFQNLRAGVLPSLLPDDFATRLRPLEDLPTTQLPTLWYPFKEGKDLFGDGSVYAINLPGHAAHQFGLACTTPTGPVFLVADACWVSLAYRKNKMPHRIARLLLDDWTAYAQTLKQLHQLHIAQPDLKILPCHCPGTSHV